MMHAVCLICNSAVGTQIKRGHQTNPDELKGASCTEYPCYPADN